MSKVAELSKQVISRQSELLSPISENITRSKVPHAHGVDTVLLPIIGGGNTLGVHIGKVRREDTLLANAIRSSVTEHSGNHTRADYCRSLQSIISDPLDKRSSIFNGAITSFSTAVSAAVADTSLAKKHQVVEAATKMASTFQGSIDKIKDLISTADADLTSKVTAMNSVLTKLLSVNQSIIKSSRDKGSSFVRSFAPSFALLDERDRLTQELAQYLPISVAFAENGTAIVWASNGKILLDRFTYVQFTNSAEIRAVTYSADDRQISESEPVNFLFQDGMIGSLLAIRDKELPKTAAEIKSVFQKVVADVNKAHNSGSSWPPSSTYRSSTKMRRTDFFDFPANSLAGRATISVVEKATGKDLSGGFDNPAAFQISPIRSLAVDLSAIGSQLPGQTKSITDVLNELNQMSYGLSHGRIALGSIEASVAPAGAVAQLTGEYLLNDIQMIARSNVQNGSFTFDIGIDGNQYFGSSVQIISVEGPAGPIDISSVSDAFRIEKGEHKGIGKRINISGLPGGNQNIDIQFRVVGDNGVVQEGTARFSVNTDDPNLMNTRIVGTPNGGDITANTLLPLTPLGPTSASLFTAKLVDENGATISEGDGTEGYLVIEANDHKNGILIDGADFSQFFQLGNLFITDSIDGSIKVRPDIISDANNLAIGSITKGAAVPVHAQSGMVSTVATLDFAGGNLANGNTLTIDDVEFTFVNAITGPNQVLIAGNLDATITNLVSAINQNRRVSLLVNSRSTAGGRLTLTALRAGTGSNNIAIAWNTGGGATISLNDLVAANANAGSTLGVNAGVGIGGSVFGVDAISTLSVSRLQFGSFQSDALKRMSALSLRIDPTESFDAMSASIAETMTSADISSQTLTTLSTQYRSKVGIDQNLELHQLREMGQYVQANMNVTKIARDLFQNILRMTE